MIAPHFTQALLEAGCDEAGRGCLAGPVFAAAVILPKNFIHPLLNDSKKMTFLRREQTRTDIEKQAIAWSVASLDNHVIDQENILWASVHAMHLALEKLKHQPQLILVDGNRFTPYRNIPNRCIVGGDGKFASIAAASVLAKTHRDQYMMTLHQEYPQYGWDKNKGYPTAAHVQAILQYGLSPCHRKSFQFSGQTRLPF